ncbi:hypothetical protein PS943_02747 [Pseudomonas fluorescens]|uniref:Uncharacterized protein n=1 Tax=Pseudomonas fluorescens TaxID=294 RepID=A0A5E7WBF6_PSEFL|nr:hypothetical protein [Pseudomonas fluorescens]VVQ32174.1 hypothetical protein PS943_02747 [Pseudomonas fluorescens]
MENFKSLLNKSKLSGENIDQAIFEITIESHNDIEEINNFASAQKEHFTLELKSDEGERYTLPHNNETTLNNQTLSLQIIKRNNSDFYVFFSEAGFASSLNSTKIQNKSRIYINAKFEEFSSKWCEFKQWNGHYPQSTPSQKTTDPRKFIKDSSGGALIEHLEFWITQHQPLISSSTFETWLNTSLGKASLIFCSEIWKEPDALKLVFSGAQNLEITYDPRKDNSFLIADNKKISEIANWVLEVEREIEIRQSLLTSRIANEQTRPKETWPSLIKRTFPKVLENTKNDYKAHLHSKSSETLKVIADIRKSIAEESAKIIERTHALSSVLFRDIAIAFGTISIKFLAAKNKDDFKTELMFLLLFTACWLAASLYMTTSTNRLYILSLAKSRYFWSRKVNQSIPISEFKELSERPFRDAVNAYDKTRHQAASIYYSVILVLLLTAVSNLSMAQSLLHYISSFRIENSPLEFSHYMNMP